MRTSLVSMLTAWSTLLSWFLLPRVHGWANLYGSQSTYVQLDDESVLCVNSSSLAREASISAVENSFSWLPSPPSGSRLALDKDGNLFAFYTSNTTSSTDTSSSSGNSSTLATVDCETSPLQVSRYSESSQSWKWITQSSANSVLLNFTIWSGDDLLYMFGGYCSEKDTVSNSLVAFNTTSLSFQQPTNSNPPRGFSSAGAANIVNDTVLLVGGSAGSSGWINLQQVAIWEYGSWTFRSAKNSTNIDSRTDPLVVPLFSSNSAYEVIVIGGSVDGRSAKPYFASLSLGDTTAWTWSSPSLSESSINGAFSVEGTLITITTDETSSNNKSKRSGGFFRRMVDKLSLRSASNFSISMYDSSSWENVQSLVTSPQSATTTLSASPVSTLVSSTSSKSATATSTTTSSKTLSSGGIAAISTIFPLSFAAAAAVGVFLIRKKRKDARKFNARTADMMPITPSLGYFDGPYPRDSDSVQSWNEKLARLGSEFDQDFDSNDYDDDHDPMQGRDVQVLVSSQRRSRLRVTNPDMFSDVSSDTMSDMSRTSSILGRQPSGTHSVHKRNKSDIVDK